MTARELAVVLVLPTHKMKNIIPSMLLSLALLATPVSAADSNEAIKAGASAVGGSVVGYGVVTATGTTCVGWLIGGAGGGCAAGPAGIVVGAVVGLAGYGIYRIFH
jgi:hypothetical protein